MKGSSSAASVVGPMGFDDLIAANGVQYEEMQAWHRPVGLMSITAGEILDWLESREDPTKRRDAGLVLIARSLAQPDPDDPETDPVKRRKIRVCDTDEKLELMVQALRNKDSATCNLIVAKVVKLNGIEASAAEAAKNA